MPGVRSQSRFICQTLGAIDNEVWLQPIKVVCQKDWAYVMLQRSHQRRVFGSFLELSFTAVPYGDRAATTLIDDGRRGLWRCARLKFLRTFAQHKSMNGLEHRS